jgi:hypothetical protein
MLFHNGVVDMLILDIDDGSSPTRGYRMMLGGRCFMILLEFPSDFCMVLWYYLCH